MDYFAEIASKADIFEALDRLIAEPNYPKRLAESYGDMVDEYPSMWRSELINWFYAYPEFASKAWIRLQYGRMAQQKVAHRAIEVVKENRWLVDLANAFGLLEVLAPIARTLARHFPAFRAPCIVEFANSKGLKFDPERDAAELELVLLSPMLQNGGEQFLDELRAVANVPFQVPALIDHLLRPAERKSGAASQDYKMFAAELIANRDKVWQRARDLAVSLPFAMVHEQELKQIDETRKAADPKGRYQEPCPKPNLTRSDPEPLPDASPIRRALNDNLIGLAFSGGGIRSATFNLGVLQALANLNLLRHCDYLSTVSGGGYIGAWFSAWMHREQERLLIATDGTADVAETLSDMRRWLSPRRTADPLSQTVRPIRYLREFSNYLTPQKGFFSADTWTMIAIYLRNFLLNLAVLIPIVAAGLLVPRAVFYFTESLFGTGINPFVIPVVIPLLLVVALLVLNPVLRRGRPRQEVAERGRSPGPENAGSNVWYARQAWMQIGVVVPLLIAGWLTSVSYWLWLKGPVQLADGRMVVHWRSAWSLSALDAPFPHKPITAAILGGVAGLALLCFLSPRWFARVSGWESLVIAIAWSGGGSFMVAELAHFSLLVTVVLMLGVFGVLIILPIFVKRARDLVPSQLSTRIVASVGGLCISLFFCFLGVGVRAVAPWVARHWTGYQWRVGEKSKSGALAVAIAVVIFLLIFARSRGFFSYWQKWRRVPAAVRAAASLALATILSGGACFGMFLGLGAFLSNSGGDEGLWKAIMFGTPLVLLAFLVVIVLQIGLLGVNFPDPQREWWSRLLAWMLIYAGIWIVFFSASLYPPIAHDWFVATLARKWGGGGAFLVWIVSTIAGIRVTPRVSEWQKKAQEAPSVAPPASHPPPRFSATLMKAVATIAPYIFIGGLLIAVSIGVDEVIWHFNPAAASEEWIRYTEYPNGLLGLFAITLVLISAIVSIRIGVNEFSMHQFYKNRLVRCYLGASRWRERRADWFTGLDRDDDMRLSWFDRHDKQGKPVQAAYIGPYPIINAALNLVAGDDLAWQERKATSFVFTPKYCGFDVDRAVLNKADGNFWPDAYAPTRSYVEDVHGPMLGMAMGISGAAANPNMGRVTSPASAFLMTVFNVRLGWWLPNPRRKGGWTHSGPPLGIAYTGLELFGLTDDKTRFGNVSDGGHFENLGVYELIRRGTRFIIASDAGQDGSFALEDLGNLVRRCRTDFGVEIDIAVDQIRERERHGWSETHCVVGKIRYVGVPRHNGKGQILREGKNQVACEEGLLIYLKPSITGDEPFDVLEYYRRVPNFPHETTADQWFNESQFESYRKLGFHIAETAFKRYRENEDAPLPCPCKFFEDLHKHWHPRDPKMAAHATDHTQEFSRLMELIGSREELAFMDASLFENSQLKTGGRNEFYICNSLIQLMENVYFDLDLEQTYDQPHVEGWMEVFRTWAKSDVFKRAWEITNASYTERFRKFYNDRLKPR